MARRMVAYCAFCAALAIVPSLWAKPPHKDALVRHYGEQLPAALRACVTCHVVPEGVPENKLAELAPEHNAFGKRLRELGTETADRKTPSLVERLTAVADEDSDGDGAANELELLGGTFPGDGTSKPTAEQLADARKRQEAFRGRYLWRPWQAVRRPDVPSAAGEWSANPIDCFISAEHAGRGLAPRPLAEKAVLLRRLYLDLIGLPPQPEELRAFLADQSPDSWQRVVERLLESPQYGQRWGRHFMDVWRYSDWAGWGAQVRDSQPHIWRWRDWIVESFNADKPYDRMILEMLAADELAPEDADALRATGFLVRNYKRLSREQWMQEAVNYTTKSLLGLTLDCARCHDHMYDPVPQEEYYRFRAIFEPHNVRIDRVPGEANVELDGLARVFDAAPDAATHFFIRGDEKQPDKERNIAPGVPAALGGPPFEVHEVALPLFARMPDKRPFVAEDDLKAAAAAAQTAQAKAAAAQQALAMAEQAAAGGGDAAKAAAAEIARREAELAQRDAEIAETKRAALAAVLRVERLEDQGGKEQDAAAWTAAAQEACAAQRQAALAEQRKARLVASLAAEKARTGKSAAEAALAAKPEDANLKAALERAAKAAEEADKALAAADEALKKSEQEAAAPPSTEYKKRALPTYPERSTGRRLALARWIADARNPLTARVAVNHVWLRHFGQPLTPSVFDFGNNGEPPTHPALLDWLAAEFMQPSLELAAGADGPRWQAASSPPAPWSFKHLHRLIVTSRTYRLASTPDEAGLAADPDNRYLWRYPTRRMEAEVVRDCVLYVAGQLDLTHGGPELDHHQGLVSRRRSLYFRHAPEKQMTFLRVFDAPSPTECFRRKESIVPQQALALANSALAIEQSRRLARHLHGRHVEGAAFVQAAYEQVLCRPPRDEERHACLEFLQQQESFFAENAQRLAGATTDLADVAKPAADPLLRARENLTLVLLNHHEFVTIR